MKNSEDSVSDSDSDSDEQIDSFKKAPEESQERKKTRF